MSQTRLAILLLLLPLPLRAAPIADGSPPVEPPRVSPSPESVPVVKLAPQSAETVGRALRYQLLPERADLQHGNAAPLWMRAGLAAREVPKKLNDDWTSPTGVALKDLPKKEIREVLLGYAKALRWAEQAARRDQCLWENPALDPHTFDFPYSELADLRLLANILSLRCRLELSEGDYDQAAQTLRTGLTLARHLGDADILIQPLVGNAIAAVMFSRVEEWMQIPGSPNLYWALTALPSPFIDCRRAVEFETNNLSTVLPQLRVLQKGSLSPEQSAALVTEMTGVVNQLIDQKTPDWQVRLAMAVYAAKIYPDARRHLLAAGYKTERLEVMSPVHVVLVYFLDQNDQLRDEVLKVLSLPPWQARVALEGVYKEVRRHIQQLTNPFLPLLFPFVQKVYEARLRLEWTVAGLRCGEALRLYAAAHHGKAPDKFTDITTVPLPIDPFTGKGFEGFYQAKDGRGVLDIPPPPSFPAHPGRRFEIEPAR